MRQLNVSIRVLLSEWSLFKGCRHILLTRLKRSLCSKYRDISKTRNLSQGQRRKVCQTWPSHLLRYLRLVLWLRIPDNISSNIFVLSL